MATATVTTKPSPVIELEKREGPEYFKFEKEGDEVAGILVGHSNVEITKDKKTQTVKKYRLAEVDLERLGSLTALTPDSIRAALTGKQLEFMATYDLASKIRLGADNGKLVHVRWAESKQTGQSSPMKIFAVTVSKHQVLTVKERESLLGSTEITDEDIPF